MDLHSSEDLAGSTVGRYLVRERLGVGGMGEVYRAEDPTLKRPVALKRLAARLRADPHYRRRFLSEAERASALNCGSIASIYDVVEKGDQVFLVMEYVEGVTLRRRLRESIPLSEFYRIAEQCLEALVAAHEKGIIHRDIKPENIMLTPTGEVKVLDFGLARRQLLSEETLDSSQLTSHTSNLAGTPGYMAPELLLESDPGPRTDIFSLGVVFFEMLHRRHPFLTRKLVVGDGQILGEESVTTHSVRVPAALEALIKRMLAKDPDARLSSAREALTELRAIEQGATLPVVPAGITIQLRTRFLKVAAIVLAAVVVGVVAWQFRRPPVPPERIRVAVLPFSNQTGNAALERFRMTLTHMLVLDLTGSPNVQVLPYERLLELSRGFEAGGKDIYQPEAIKTVADYSGSRYVVVPSMFAAGNMLRLSAEFRDVRTGETVAAAKAERALSGSPEETFYAMQDELADSIQDYFKRVGPGQTYEARPPTGRPRTVTAAFNYTEAKNALAQGNTARALGFLQRAIDEDPDFALAYARMSQVYGALGYDDRAREPAEKASQLIRGETPVVDALLIQANLAERNYDYSLAEQKYQELIRLYPDDPDALAGLAAVHINQVRYAAAISRYLEALRLDPNYVVVHQRLSWLYTRTGDLARAVEHGQRAVELCRAINNREGEVDALLNLGEIYRVKGDAAKAWETAQDASRVAQSLGYEASLLATEKFLGDVLASQGKLEEARRHYLPVIETGAEVRNNRFQAQTLMNIGVTYWNQGDLAKARDYFEQSLAQWRRYGEYRDVPALRQRAQLLANFGALLMQSGPDPERGARYAQEALSLFRTMGETYWEALSLRNLGTHSLNAGSFQQANQSLQQARDLFQKVQAGPQVTQATYFQASAFFYQNRYQLARLAADAALAQAREAKHPFQVPNVELLSGWIYLRLGDTARARSLLEEALQAALKGGYGELLPDAYAALGELHLELGDRGRARSYWQKGAVLWKEPSVSEASIEARSNLGLLLAEEGTADRGLAECRAALQGARRLQHYHTIARATLNLAQVHLLRHEAKMALEVLNPLLSAQADLGGEWQARAWFLQAQALANLGQKEQAGAARQRAREAILQLQRELDPADRQGFASRRDVRAILEEPPLRRAS
ncbi:MAG TPA: protein kinase [Terriglobales bacterium]|nr:protein kinase [Terriglobales bacterium]